MINVGGGGVKGGHAAAIDKRGHGWEFFTAAVAPGADAWDAAAWAAAGLPVDGHLSIILTVAWGEGFDNAATDI